VKSSENAIDVACALCTPWPTTGQAVFPRFIAARWRLHQPELDVYRDMKPVEQTTQAEKRQLDDAQDYSLNNKFFIEA